MIKNGWTRRGRVGINVVQVADYTATVVGGGGRVGITCYSRGTLESYSSTWASVLLVNAVVGFTATVAGGRVGITSGPRSLLTATKVECR